MKDKRHFRHPDDLTDSEEELHPNIDTKSFQRFMKEENKKRLEFLRSKKDLTDEELKEKEKLEYKFLPVDVEVPENSFRISKDFDSEESNTDELIYLFNNFSIDNIIQVLDYKIKNIENFEELIYLNISNAIKEGNDDIGYEFSKIGLFVRWARIYGRSYLNKLKNYKESDLEKIFQEYYQASKDAILSLKDE